LVFVVGRWDFFQIFGFENLVAIEATNVIDSVASRQHFGTVVLAEHRNEIKPILSGWETLSSPPFVRLAGENGDPY
jgi:hypothetical protein